MSNATTTEPVASGGEDRRPPPKVNRWLLYFGLLGGAIAWAAHLLAVYVIGEFGCFTAFRERMFAGMTVVAWLVILATVAATGVGLAAVWVAYRLDVILEVGERGGTDTPASRAHLARLGLITSALFVFIILAQAFPIIYFLREC
jgi:hypothetical protein